MAQGSFGGMSKLFCILSVVVMVLGINTYFKIHRTVHQKEDKKSNLLNIVLNGSIIDTGGQDFNSLGITTPKNGVK